MADETGKIVLDPKSVKHWITILLPVLLALFGGPKLSEITGWTESGVQVGEVDKAVEDKFDTALEETKDELKAEMAEKVGDLKTRIQSNLTAMDKALGNLKELMIEKLKDSTRNRYDIDRITRQIETLQDDINKLEQILSGR